jgi:hypothetical protein
MISNEYINIKMEFENAELLKYNVEYIDKYIALKFGLEDVDENFTFIEKTDINGELDDEFIKKRFDSLLKELREEYPKLKKEDQYKYISTLGALREGVENKTIIKKGELSHKCIYVKYKDIRFAYPKFESENDIDPFIIQCVKFHEYIKTLPEYFIKKEVPLDNKDIILFVQQGEGKLVNNGYYKTTTVKHEEYKKHLLKYKKSYTHYEDDDDDEHDNLYDLFMEADILEGKIPKNMRPTNLFDFIDEIHKKIEKNKHKKCEYTSKREQCKNNVCLEGNLHYSNDLKYCKKHLKC